MQSCLVLRGYVTLSLRMQALRHPAKSASASPACRRASRMRQMSSARTTMRCPRRRHCHYHRLRMACQGLRHLHLPEDRLEQRLTPSVPHLVCRRHHLAPRELSWSSTHLLHRHLQDHRHRLASCPCTWRERRLVQAKMPSAERLGSLSQEHSECPRHHRGAAQHLVWRHRRRRGCFLQALEEMRSASGSPRTAWTGAQTTPCARCRQICSGR
mmetsp:Transcript_28439/g.51680  ORF Transcript_28439/g.51680 Transcript_28439/m.51680 type:complete len:213 (+) Transcript_28439:246-884(+)